MNPEIHEFSENPAIFQGPVRPVLIKMSLPILAGMIFQLFYNMVDTFFISRIDLSNPSYVGGVGLIFPLIFLFIALGNGLSIGVSSLVARAIGDKNHTILEKTAESGLFIGAILSVFSILIIALGGDKIVYFLGARGEYYLHGYEYLINLLPAALFIFAGSALMGILQGEGKMKHVMNSMILGTIVNIILDPFFIFIMHMDVKGAALATVAGQGISFCYVLAVFLKNASSIQIAWKKQNIKRSVIGKILAIGLPQAMGMILMAVSFLFFNRLVVSIDPLALTAFSLFGRFEQLVLMPGFALGAGVITLVGQNSGRGNFDRVKTIMQTSWLIGVAATLLLAALMVLGAKYIYPVFSEIPEVVNYAVKQTYTLEFFYVFALLGIVNRNFFQAVGYPVPAFILTLFRTILLSLPLAYLLVRECHWGIEGVWWGLNFSGMITASTSTAVVLYIINRLKKGTLSIRKV